MLGVAIHFFIALDIVLVYFLGSRRLKFLTERPVVCGAVYGIAVYAVMNLVVIPLSAIGWRSVPKSTVTAAAHGRRTRIVTPLGLGCGPRIECGSWWAPPIS